MSTNRLFHNINQNYQKYYFSNKDHELNKYLWARKTFFETTTVEAASMQFCRYYLRPEFTAETTILFPVKDGGRFPSGENKKRKGETNRFENATEVYRLLSQGGNK